MSPVALKNVPTYIVPIDNFRTIAHKTQGELLNPNIGSEAFNLRFDETFGSILKRKNRSSYGNMTTLGTSKVISAYRFYKNSTNAKYQLIAYDTTLKVGSDMAGTFTNIKTGITKDRRWTWLTYKSICYAFNGIDNNQVYDGTNNCDMGVPIPTAPSGVDAGSGDYPTGALKYKVSYLIDSYQEGAASAASDTVNVTTNNVTLTIPVSTNPRVTGRVIYRTAASGAIYYYVATVSNNTATTYTDSTADASLDTTVTAPTDYGVPSSYQYSALHKSRFFLARNATYKSRIIYSDVRSGTSYPDVYPALNYIDVLKDNGEELTWVGEDNFGQLIAMKPSAVVKINTDTDDPVGWSGMNSVISLNGCIAPYSAVKTSIGVIYLSRFGELKKRLMVWSGSSAQPLFEELEPVLSAIFDTRLENVVGYYYNNSYYLAYNDDTDETTYNNRLLIINLQTGAWVIDKKNIDCFSFWNSSNDWGELYTGSSDTVGLLYREDTDVSTQADTIIDTKSELDLGTFSQCVSAGTEASPTLVLIEAQLTNDIGATIVSAASGIVSTYDVQEDNETVAPSCTYTSPVYEVNAKQFSSLFWREIIGTGGYVRFWVRVGDTSALCQAASWNGPYSYSAGGVDISGVTAAKYIQYMCKLYVQVTTNAAGTYLYTDGYLAKIIYGYGTVAESAIELIYSSNWLDFSWVNPSFKRIRKRIRAVKIEFDRSAVSGTLTFGYQKDGSSNRTDVNFALASYAAKGWITYNFPLGVYCNTLKYRLYNNDDDTLTIKKIIFVLSPEPYYPNL